MCNKYTIIPIHLRYKIYIRYIYYKIYTLNILFKFYRITIFIYNIIYYIIYGVNIQKYNSLWSIYTMHKIVKFA